MKPQAAIACMMLLLLSTGLVSGEGVNLPIAYDFPALAGMTDTLAHDVVISILEKGEDYNPYKGNEDEYLAFQVGFFSGHGVGYIAEQLLAGKGVGTATKSAKITKYGAKYASLGAKFADELRELKLAIKALDEASTFGKVTKGVFMGSEKITSLGGKLIVTSVSDSKAVVKEVRKSVKNFDELGYTQRAGEFGEELGKVKIIEEYGSNSVKYYDGTTGKWADILKNHKTSSSGIDIIAKDKDGVWHLIEVKYVGAESYVSKNVDLSILSNPGIGRQGGEEWCKKSLKKMKKGEGGYPKINREIADEILDAIRYTPDKVKREVLIVQPMGKSLPTQGLMNFVDGIHVIKLDEDILRANNLLKW